MIVYFESEKFQGVNFIFGKWRADYQRRSLTQLRIHEERNKKEKNDFLSLIDSIVRSSVYETESHRWIVLKVAWQINRVK